jgi:hypothetical protein
MRIVGVNGIATDGAGSIDLLLLELAERGHVVIDVPLPKRHFVSARWGACPDGQLVAQRARDGDIVVAHSFGCLRTFHAHKVRNFAAVVCIAPAMSDAAEWLYPERVHCFHSRRDWAVRFGSMLLFHPFGPAGVRGFIQDGITNIERQCGHSDYFAGERLTELADYVERLAR